MCNEHVGSLVVVAREDPLRNPIGILTDRDIVRGQLRRAADLTEAIEALHAHTVRRAPVLDGFGALAGMVTLDDLLPAVTQELGALAGLMGSQAGHERAPHR